MSEELPVELIDEASLALTSVVRLTLPAERWAAVGEAVHRMDDAVWDGDEKTLRAELKKLRGAVVGTAPRRRPGEGAAPTINPLSYRTTDYVTRTPVRMISIILIGCAVLLATLLVLVMVVLAVGPERSAAPGESPTTVSAPTVTPTPEPAPGPQGSGEGSGNLYLASLGALVLAGIGGFAVMIWRRRSRGAPAPEADAEPEPVTFIASVDRVSPPPEVAEAVDRAVAVLSARRDMP